MCLVGLGALVDFAVVLCGCPAGGGSGGEGFAASGWWVEVGTVLASRCLCDALQATGARAAATTVQHAHVPHHPPHLPQSHPKQVLRLFACLTPP